jgi:hypothetical protein
MATVTIRTDELIHAVLQDLQTRRVRLGNAIGRRIEDAESAK